MATLTSHRCPLKASSTIHVRTERTADLGCLAASPSANLRKDTQLIRLVEEDEKFAPTSHC